MEHKGKQASDLNSLFPKGASLTGHQQNANANRHPEETHQRDLLSSGLGDGLALTTGATLTLPIYEMGHSHGHLLGSRDRPRRRTGVLRGAPGLANKPAISFPY